MFSWLTIAFGCIVQSQQRCLISELAAVNVVAYVSSSSCQVEAICASTYLLTICITY